MTDIEIAQAAKLLPISKVAAAAELKNVIPYGEYMAKVPYNDYGQKKGKLILVSAINPTPLGEGKTTMSIGLADGLRAIGKNVALCLREPSLGPVFGVKGGAAGGGYAQVVPMENINLHFTGDLHAIETANNLLAALIDNHIYQGNELKISKVTWKRCMDMNDRQLRHITSGLGGAVNGIPRDDGFDITVASEVMAIFCLANSLSDLTERLGNIIIGYNDIDQPVYARDLKAEGAMTALLKDAFNPNLVQTLEHTPAFIHGGPFANIAHGCNSIVATKLALSHFDYVVTEAGFGADLGAEKFLDIKCPQLEQYPDAIVLVATAKALKYNGGIPKEEVSRENIGALRVGICNLQRHIENLTSYGLPVVVVINRFGHDTDIEIELIRDSITAPCVVCTSFAHGSNGGIDFAHKVLEHLRTNNDAVVHPYNKEQNIVDKVVDLARNIYHASGVHFSKEALDMISKIENMGYTHLPICVAKTQYSFSDNAKLLGAPKEFEMEVKEVRLSAGAGFVVVICGKIMTMPGLPKIPAANNIGLDDDNNIIGLF